MHPNCYSVLLSSFPINTSNGMICQQNVAARRPWSIPKMCHPGRVNGSGLIGSPYSALEPISASRMMYTSLNACRQWQLPPFIQASHGNTSPTPPHPHPRAQAYVQHMQMGKTVHIPPPPAFMFLSSSVIYHPTNKGVQGRALACKHARAIVWAQSCVRSRSSSFAFNMHGAGGQRALLDIRSASSNSKRHQRLPAAILRATMRWRAQWKAVMSAGSESRLSSARPCSASPSIAAMQAATGGSQDLHSARKSQARALGAPLEKRASPSRLCFLVVLPDWCCSTP